MGSEEGASGDVGTPASRGGRPSREEAELIRERILDVATELFLQEGYGATSIEAVAQRLRMSKRTFYHRFRDKAELFDAVVHRIVDALRPADLNPLFAGDDAEEILVRLAGLAIAAAVNPKAIALQRLILAEATRFPELASIALGEGSRRQGIEGIAALLKRQPWSAGLSDDDARLAAEQFLQMVVSIPQRRAMGLGTPMSEEERRHWTQATVRLFLCGVRGWKAGPA